MEYLSQRNQGIDLYRGIGCLIVFTGHFISHFGYYEIFPNFYQALKIVGMIMVQSFFIISAFLLANSFCKYEVLYKKPRVVFFIKRFAKIYPLWALNSIIYFFFRRLEFDELTPKYLLMNLSFLFGFFPGNYMNYTTLGWTIFVEEVFYITAPLIFFIKRIRWLFVVALIAYFVRVITFDFFFSIATPEVVTLATRNPVRYYYMFLIGIILSKTMSLPIKKRIVSLSFLYSIFGIISFYYFDFPVILASLIIVLFYYFKFENILIKAIKVIGRDCYAFYLFHITFFSFIEFIKIYPRGEKTLLHFFSTFCLTLVIFSLLARLITKYIEAPCIQLFKPLYEKF